MSVAARLAALRAARPALGREAQQDEQGPPTPPVAGSIPVAPILPADPPPEVEIAARPLPDPRVAPAPPGGERPVVPDRGSVGRRGLGDQPGAPGGGARPP